MVIPDGKDVECFLDRTKSHFSKLGGKRSDDQRRRQMEQLIAQLGEEAAKKLDPAMISGAIDIQMVENISLLPNRKIRIFI